MLDRFFGNRGHEDANEDGQESATPTLGAHDSSGDESPAGQSTATEDNNGEVATQALEWHAPVLTRVDDDTSIPTLLQQRVERDPRSPLVEIKQVWRLP